MLNVVESSATIEIPTPRVVLHTIFKANTKLMNDFRGKEYMVHKVSFLEESDMTDPTVYNSHITFGLKLLR